MKRKKLCAMLTGLALAVGMMTVPASAAAAPGVYTASMVTSYYNPDTGNVDDGGTANAALGEGMCRSATDTTALVEVDASGNVWLTVRLLLQSNCSNVVFYTRSGYDSYSKVSYDIISEDAGNDSIDYRFKVSEPGQKLKCTMYVSPMGRNVLWYLYVDTSTLKSGSGDFVVSIDTNAAAAGSTSSGSSTTTSKTKTSTAAQSPAASKPTSGSTTGTAAAGTTQPTTDTTAQTPEETTETTEGTETTGTAETPTDATQIPEEEMAKDSQTAEDVDTEEMSSTDEEAAASESGGSGPVIGVIVVVVLAACAAVYMIRRKKK